MLVPVFIESVQAHEIGLYGQGRYSLPMAVGVPILAGWMIADAPVAATRVGRRIGTAGVVVVAVGRRVRAALRLGHGPESLCRGALQPCAFSSLHGTGWRPPLGTTALFVLALIGFVAYAGWTIRLAIGCP